MSAPQPWTQQVVDRSDAGQHRVWVTRPGHAAVDVTYFRNIPAQLSSYVFADPFGPSTAEISFPQITAYEQPGEGDLFWLHQGADVNITWVYASTGLASTTWRWEGYIASLAYAQDESSSSVSVQCKGALYQVDNFLAEPQFIVSPLPYELAIKQRLDPTTTPDLHTGALTVTFPSYWTTTVPASALTGFAELRPQGVKTGDKWTGLVTRSTGSWDKRLTSYIQGLLSMMFVPDGSQWTVILNYGRKPQLLVRQIRYSIDSYTHEVTLGQPGVSASLNEDWTQAANVYFGKGTDVGGDDFSNEVISNGGGKTGYLPFAAQHQVYPAATSNKWWTKDVMRQETHVQFDQGISPIDAQAVAISSLQRSAHPGYTGTITLKVDTERNNATYSRWLLMPGMQIYLHGFKGVGVLLHIAQVSANVADGSVELTVDSKFRDLLTIEQVRARSRDALSTIRALQVGKLSVQINDQQKRWSYSAGSGVIPSSPITGQPNGKDLFVKYNTANEAFPWRNLVKKYPPHKHPTWYIRIEKPSTDFTKNWSGSGTKRYAIGVLLSQSGNIRMTQIAAYDANGNVMKIPFHVSFYTAAGINPTSMPMIPKDKTNPSYLASLKNHAGQHYPFFPGAFESIYPDGSPKVSGDFTNHQDSFMLGWGNYYQRAGYYPGLYGDHDKVTGLLVDETTWSYDTTKANFLLNPTYPAKVAQNKLAGLVYIMIYAEALPRNQPVFFLGRCFRDVLGAT
jgi:hypothetical protein